MSDEPEVAERQTAEWLTRPRWVLQTLTFYCVFLVWGLAFDLLLFVPLWLLGRLHPATRRWPPRLARWFFRLLIRALWLVRAMRIVSIDGRERLALGEPAVYVANHRSMMDVLIMLSLVRDASCLLRSWSRVPEAAAAEEEEEEGGRPVIPGFWKPFITGAFSLLGYVPMPNDWSDLGALRTAYDDCLATLRAGRPLVIFPEGTRSSTSRLLPFVDFPFKLALDAGVPVVPVVIHSQVPIIPKGSISIHAEARADFRLSVLEPVRVRRGERAKDLSFTTRKMIRKVLKAHDREHGYRLQRRRPPW